MSREPPRRGYISRDPRNRDREWNRPSDYRSRPPGDRRSRSPPRRDQRDMDKRSSRSPRKNDKDMIDDNILSEISKLPEPSELWDSRFQDAGYPAPPPPGTSFPPESVKWVPDYIESIPRYGAMGTMDRSAPVPNQNYGSNYQPSYSGIYDDFPPVASLPSAPHPPDISAWNQMSLPPPPAPAPPPPFMGSSEDQLKKEAAIESEMRHQKAALSKQREDYMKKASILKKELDTLKDQRSELRGDSKRSPSPDTKRFLKENTKLQLEIQNKLKTINNVVDMLNGIIGEEAQELPHLSDESPERSSKRKSRSPSASQKFNYVYYDPEMHWCRVCNEFPSTAKDYLNHLHSQPHNKMAAAHMEAPWHTVTGLNEGFPSFPSAPTKRTPIKGLQFFVPSTAWYCKLCDQFIGDLHCASAHLKSVTHSKNYTNFVEQNPHWETDWMSDRQKSFEKARASSKNKPAAAATEEKPNYTSHTITFNKDGFHTKLKNSPPPAEEKKKKKEKKKPKKKKRSSSSSSSSNSSSSDSEPVKKKKKKKEKKSDPDDKTLNEWMTSIQADRLNESDRKLLDTLKSRMKLEGKGRSPDRSRESTKRRESEVRESRAREVRDRERERERDRDRERERDRRGESRHRERSSERRHERARHTPPHDKKPEIRKMPFIGKMPVYKSLGKNKTEEQKKDEEKKKEEEEATKKRREEMDAEIQKKVAEFKEKIAKAQLDRQLQADIPPPAIALPTALGGTVPPAAYIAPPPPPPAPAPAPPAPAPVPTQVTAAPPTLPKDFQDALDIIFPSEVKPDLSQQDLFGQMPLGGFPMGLGGVMPPFPPFLQPQMPQMPQMMMGFDMNGSLFPPRTQLYDTHVPLVPSPKMRPKNTKKNNPYPKKMHNPHTQPKTLSKNQNQSTNKPPPKQEAAKEVKENGEAAVKAQAQAQAKKEEMEDLAMLGIDASDVGAGI